MHRRVQFGMPENPASPRRHDSGSAIGTVENPSMAGSSRGPQLTQQDTNKHSTLSRNAAQIATGGRENTVTVHTDPSERLMPSSVRYEQSFEALITSTAAARLLGNLHVKTLQRYARLGRIPGYQIGGHWYFRESELDAWLRHQINSKCQSVR